MEDYKKNQQLDLEEKQRLVIQKKQQAEQEALLLEIIQKFSGFANPVLYYVLLRIIIVSNLLGPLSASVLNKIVPEFIISDNEYTIHYKKDNTSYNVRLDNMDIDKEYGPQSSELVEEAKIQGKSCIYKGEQVSFFAHDLNPLLERLNCHFVKWSEIVYDLHNFENSEKKIILLLCHYQNPIKPCETPELQKWFSVRLVFTKIVC